MRGLMPSEVARLVLGYLKETKCEKTVGMFLNESPHLCEYVECLLKGKEYPTSINGYSLYCILNDFQPQSCHQQSQLCSDHASELRGETASVSMCTRDLLLLARNQYKPKLVSVGCGDDLVGVKKQTSCQTSPTRTNYPTLVQVNSTCVREEPRIDLPVNVTSTRLSAISPFSTPSRPVDLYSSPSSLVKSALFNLRSSQVTPVKFGDGSTGGVDRINSPRRKDCYPRKRLCSPGTKSPSSARKRLYDNFESGSSCFSSPSNDAENAVSTTGSTIELTLIESLLQNSALQEVIAANINEELPGATISIPESADEQLSETIGNIVNRTENNPAFDVFLKSLFPEINEGNATLSPMNSLDTEMKGDDVASLEKAVEVRTRDWSTSSTTSSTTATVENNPLYVLPNCNNASIVQLVTGGVSSSNGIHKADEKGNTGESPIKVLKAGAVVIQDIQQNSRIIRKKKRNPCETLKQNFANRQCAVKALNFKSGTNVSIVDHAKVRTASQKELPIGSRLRSLIKTVETQTKKPDENLTLNKSNKVEEVRKENTTTKPQDKSNGNPNKTSEIEESVRKTTEKEKSEAVLSKVNIDNILSNVKYVD